MLDASALATGQRNRLAALARAGKSLPWVRSDDALAARKLVRRYSEPFGGDFSDLTNDGMVMAQRILRR